MLFGCTAGKHLVYLGNIDAVDIFRLGDRAFAQKRHTHRAAFGTIREQQEITKNGRISAIVGRHDAGCLLSTKHGSPSRFSPLPVPTKSITAPRATALVEMHADPVCTVCGRDVQRRPAASASIASTRESGRMSVQWVLT